MTDWARRCCYHPNDPAECLWFRKDGPCCPHCVEARLGQDGD
jgi:hypothetical protein